MPSVLELSDENEHTYNSEAIEEVRWYEEHNHQDCQRGCLIVTFKNGRHYLYDLPEMIFDEMAYRAHNPDEGGDKLSSHTWFKEIIDNCFPEQDDKYYTDKQVGGDSEDLLES